VGVSDSCGGDPFGDLRDGRAAAAGRVLYRSPGMLGLQHLCDANVALLVFRPALVDASWLRLGLTFCLPTTTIFVILASDSRGHVEQHAVDRVEHARGELIAVAGCHDPRRRQIERHDADALGRKLGLKLLPVAIGETR